MYAACILLSSVFFINLSKTTLNIIQTVVMQKKAIYTDILLNPLNVCEIHTKNTVPNPPIVPKTTAHI